MSVSDEIDQDTKIEMLIERVTALTNYLSYLFCVVDCQQQTIWQLSKLVILREGGDNRTLH